MFPDAELFTLIHVPGSTSPRIEALRITASPLSRLPGAARHYRKLLPLFPAAIERLRLPPCDLVLSTSHAVAKAVRAPRGAATSATASRPCVTSGTRPTPTWAAASGARCARPLAACLRRFDRRTSGPERVHRVVAISTHVAERVRRDWGRDADVVYPAGRRSSASRRARKVRRTSTSSSAASCPTSARISLCDAFAALGRPLLVVRRRPLAPPARGGGAAERALPRPAWTTPSSPTSTRAAARSSTRRRRTSGSSRSRRRRRGGP